MKKIIKEQFEEMMKVCEGECVSCDKTKMLHEICFDCIMDIAKSLNEEKRRKDLIDYETYINEHTPHKIEIIVNEYLNQKPKAQIEKDEDEDAKPYQE
jgi:hypothetical protein